MSTGTNIAIGLEKVWNASTELADTGMAIGSDMVQKQAAIDSTYMQSQLDIDAANFMQELSTKPAGTDYAAEIDNYMEKMRSQMSDPNSKYYARNNFTAKMYERVLENTRSNLQVKGVQLRAQKERDDSLAKTEEIERANFNTLGYNPESAENTLQAWDTEFELGHITAEQLTEQTNRVLSTATTEMISDVYNKKLEEYAKTGKSLDLQQIEKETQIEVKNQMEQKFGERYVTTDFDKAGELGIQKGQKRRQDIYKRNTDAELREISKLRDDLSMGRISKAQAVNICKNKIMQVEKYTEADMTNSQREETLSNYRGLLNTLEVAENTGSKSASGAVSFKTIKDICAEVRATDDQYLIEVLLDPNNQQPVYGIKDGFMQLFNDDIQEAIFQMRMNGASDEEIGLELLKLDAAFGEFTGLLMKNLDKLPENKRAPLTKAIERGKVLLSQRSGKSPETYKSDCEQLTRFIVDFVSGQNFNALTEDQLNKTVEDYIDGMTGKNIDRLTYGEKGMPEYTDNKGVAKFLQQSNNDHLLWTDETGKKVFVDKNMEDKIWNGPEQQAIRYSLFENLKKLDPSLSLKDVTCQWEVDDTSYDINPRVTYTVNKGTFNGVTYRLVSDDGKTVRTEKKKKGESWSEVKNMKHDFNTKKIADKKKEEIQKLQKEEYKENKKKEDSTTRAKGIPGFTPKYEFNENGEILYDLFGVKLTEQQIIEMQKKSGRK